jgi:transposase InsO family protein
MDNKQKIAVFRFGIISPVLHGNQRNQSQYFKKMAETEYDVPGIGWIKYRWRTFKRWLIRYRKYGIDGLIPVTREDKGKSRKIDKSLRARIMAEAEENDLKTVSNFYRYLIREEIITPEAFTEATLRNFLKSNNFAFNSQSRKARKSFEMPHINMLWTADFMHGPYLKTGRKKQKTYLCIIIDDHSRLITGARFFLEESSLSLQKTLKDAVLTYAVPQKLYCDNGKIFVSGYIHIVCARIGTALIHSKPYDSPSRGKIERLIRTVRLMFLPNINIDDNYSLKDLNRDLTNWINLGYNRKIHGVTGEAPLDRYIKDSVNVTLKQISKNEADDLFYHTIYRTVRGDCVVSFKNVLYEVPAKYIGKKVELRHPLDDPFDLRLYEDNKQVIKLTKLDKNFNAESTINYHREEEEDV